ncbi:hypothetical protein I306_06238 [Cryptococcus gattii EJB2]|uniref:Uncharacterized protein n=1 Tax=Cryptococcus gattii EJB2 TaxID=1296103 RepID=A0ABR5BML6_9TREE|nr:hypothetical protein I306_06238 [Cryptococcus gattii EJB2]
MLDIVHLLPCPSPVVRLPLPRPSRHLLGFHLYGQEVIFLPLLTPPIHWWQVKLRVHNLNRFVYRNTLLISTTNSTPGTLLILFSHVRCSIISSIYTLIISTA